LQDLYFSASYYDLMAVIGYNDDPIVPGRGSAIFFHVAGVDMGPTAGCVALTLPALRWVLAQLVADTYMNIV
jgi:L,D-peptidoglycan transpeptidase YkuD (ErfK/YbiS/YcfS/YnhG family)